MILETVIHTDEQGNEGIMPIYSTAYAACADVTCPKSITIEPGETALIDLLISFEMDSQYKVLMYPRSSLLVKRGLIQPTSVIDADYKGHVHVPLYNPTNKTVVINRNERVAQIECVPRYDFDTDWPRLNVERSGGFGSTGK